MDSQRRAQLQASLRPLDPHDPTRVGPYELESKLGEGGMGAVYLGRRPGGPVVAIKVVRTELANDPAFLGRFRDEVVNAERVASFCTAQVLDHGEADGRAYMVTEYIDGPSLLDYVSENGSLAPGMLHGVAVGVAAALVAIHAAGLVHRDLKPSNVLLSMSGPRVIDFGIARALDGTASHTATGQVIGSAGWIAPEQILNHPITPAVDVFAWGCLVVFAANGRNPYGTGSFQVMAARVVHAAPDLGVLPGSLAGLVQRALDKDPSRRPSSQELLLALVGGVGEAAVSTTLGEAWPEPAAPLQQVQQPAPPPPVPTTPAPLPPRQHTHPGTEVVREDTHPRTARVEAYGAPAGPVPPANETRTEPTEYPQAPPQPWPPPSTRPQRPKQNRSRVVAAAAAGVFLVIGGVAGGVYALTSGDNDDKGGEGPPVQAASEGSALPTSDMLVRVDTAAGWYQECHAKIGKLVPSPKTAQPSTVLEGEGCDVLPQWSPTRDKIAFTRTASDTAQTSDAYVMNANGTGATRVYEGIARRSRISWSPNGQQLAVMIKKGEVNQLHVIDLNSRKAEPLTDDPSEKDDPTWSGDGKIAFWSGKDGSRQIYSLDPDEPGGPIDPADWKQVTTTEDAPNGVNDPDWSPNSKWIAFTLVKKNGKNDIAVIDADGEGFRQLTTSSAHDMDPNWSPGGKWLAFVRGPVSTPQVFAMPVDRGEASAAIAISQPAVGHPNWSNS